MECGCVLGVGRGPGSRLLIDVREVRKCVKTLLCFPILLSHLFLQHHLFIIIDLILMSAHCLTEKYFQRLCNRRNKQLPYFHSTCIPYMPRFLSSTDQPTMGNDVKTKDRGKNNSQAKCLFLLSGTLVQSLFSPSSAILQTTTAQYKCQPHRSDQIRSVAQSCPTLCDPMNHSTPGLPVHHQLPEFTQTHVLRVSDAIQPSHPLSSPSPLASNPSQHQSLFQ